MAELDELAEVLRDAWYGGRVPQRLGETSPRTRDKWLRVASAALAARSQRPEGVRVVCLRCGRPVETIAGHFPTCPPERPAMLRARASRRPEGCVQCGGSGRVPFEPDDVASVLLGPDHPCLDCTPLAQRPEGEPLCAHGFPARIGCLHSECSMTPVEHQRPEGVTVTGASLIAAERRRQVEVEGYTAEHDREHGPGQLARAANCYRRGDRTGWPWWPEAWKPKDHLSNLIRSGALYLAALAIADSHKTHGSVNEIPHYLRQGLDGVTSEIDAILAKAAEVSGDTETGGDHG